MDLICVILDCQPAYLADQGTSRSLLTMPLGCGTVLSDLSDAVREAGCSDLRILPTFTPSDDYEEQMRRVAPAGTKVVDENVITSLVREYEPSDHVLIIDPRYRPAGGLDLSAVLRDRSGTRWASHRVATEWSAGGTRECVRCNEDGQVTRIVRDYQDVTCSRIAATMHSLIPLVASLEGLRLRSLADLRATLSSRGLLSRDLPVSSGVIDLSWERGLLTSNEHWTMRAGTVETPDGFTRMRPGTLVGPHCRIHPSVRIVSPVIIQEHVTIEAGASVVGPSVIGRGSKIHSGALVAQAVVGMESTVASDERVRHVAIHGDRRRQRDAMPGDRGMAEPIPFLQADGHMVRQATDASSPSDARIALRSIYPFLKLAADSLVATVSLVLLAPLFLLTAIAVKLDSPGPAFFGHTREGKGGKGFACWKFRTMCQDAHQRQRRLYAENALDGPQFKLDNDPRVTRVGAWLRATNIDELPQLINVFLGQMSIVGPRPSPFRENQICVPWRRARLSVRPGITGLWQICRDQRVEGDFHQWITYDIMYVRHLSLWLDLKILLATLGTLGGLWSVPHTWLVPDPARAYAGFGPMEYQTPASG